MAKIRGIAVTYHTMATDKTAMALFPKLEIVGSFGVGYDPIDVPAAQARGIAISNTPEVLNDCVADLAMGLIIDGRRQLSRADRFVRAGGWLNGNLPLARRVTGSRLGILGLGRIGLAVARRAEGFAMPVRYHNRRPITDCPYEYAGSLVELARWADVLLLTCVGGPQTRGLVDRDVLDALVSDMQAQQPDHVAVTGDLVNLALDAEFNPARQWLEGVGDPADVTVVPGNHDA